MLLKCERGPLLEAITLASNAVPSRETIPILKHIAITVDSDTSLARIDATDNEIYLSNQIGVSDCEPGSILVPAAKLLGLLRESNSERVSIFNRDNHVILKMDRSEFKIPSGDKKKFPSWKIEEIDDSHVVAASSLRNGIKNSVFAANQGEDSSTVLGGVLWDIFEGNLILSCTDTRRISVVQLGITESDASWPSVQTVIPMKAAKLIERSIGNEDGELKFRFTDNKAFFMINSCWISTLLLTGRFPPYRRIIKEIVRNNKVSFDTKILNTAVRQLSIMTSVDSRMVVFSFNNGILQINSWDNQSGSSSQIEIECDYAGEPVEFGLNPIYVADFLSRIDSENVVMEFQNDRLPVCMYKENDQSFLYNIMPMGKEKKAEDQGTDQQ